VFYLTFTINTSAYPNTNKLTPPNQAVRDHLDVLEAKSRLAVDKLFAYELIGAEGVCVVPLSGFSSPVPGFRMTLLEEDEALFEETCHRIRRGAEAFFTA
jgi:alanine-synthesizing transaminase